MDTKFHGKQVAGKQTPQPRVSCNTQLSTQLSSALNINTVLTHPRAFMIVARSHTCMPAEGQADTRDAHFPPC